MRTRFFSSSLVSGASPLLSVPLAAFCFQANGELMATWAVVGLVLVVLSALAGAALWRNHSWPKLLCLWLAYGGLSALNADGQAKQALELRLAPEVEGEVLLVKGFVNAMPLHGEQGIRYRFWVSACQGQACPLARTLRLSQYAGFGKNRDLSLAEFPSDRDLCLQVKLKRPVSTLNPYAFDAELRALEEGIAATGGIRAVLDCGPLTTRFTAHASLAEQVMPRLLATVERARARLRDSLRRALELASSDRDRLSLAAKATIVALVVGEQSAISNAWWTIFNQTGVGHLMSISGLHITLFAALTLGALRLLFRVKRVFAVLLCLRIAPSTFSWLLAVMAAFSYSLISGWGIPAQRTCWMLAAAAWGLSCGRSKRMSKVLALGAALVTVLDPWAPMAAGFWLSFGAVAALVWCGARDDSRPQPWYRSALRTQSAATLSLAPLGAMFFGSFSMVGPLANAFAIPFVSSLLTPYVLITSLLSTLWSAAAGWVLVPAVWSTRWMLIALESLANLPWSTLTLARPSGFGLLVASLACAGLLSPMGKARVKALYGLGLLPLMTIPVETPQEDELWLTAFDVGQGMAVLIETSTRRLMYDAGPSYGSESEAGSRIILPYLRARGISSIDAMVISHADNDHSGGARELAGKLKPAWTASSLTDSERLYQRRHYPCVEGQRWVWGNAQWEFLHPALNNVTAVKSTTNARSCVLQLRHPAVTVLLPGDLEAAQEKRLVAQYGELLQSQVLLAPHHGSASSSSEAFLKAVKPTWAIFQVGYRNRFRHPSSKVLPRYEALGTGILRSDRDGAIHLRFKSGRPPEVRRIRMEQPPYWRIAL
jgi:competence protein ComEC